MKRTRDCRLKDPSCLLKLEQNESIKSDAIAQILDTSSPRLGANCSNGEPPPSNFDVVVHNRMYTTRFEGRDEAQFRGPDARPPPDLRLERLPPFWELVRPIARYIAGRGLRKTVFLASNVAASKREIANRFVDFGVVVCEVPSSVQLLKHPDKMERPQYFCDDCIDVTFSEWMSFRPRGSSFDESRRRRGRDVDSPWRRVDAAAATRPYERDGRRYLARARHLVAQLGMHCLDDAGTCLSPKDRILGRASSFSHVAATVAEVLRRPSGSW